MKKIYITIFVLVFSVSLFGQAYIDETINNVVNDTEASVSTQIFTSSFSSSAMLVDTIWAENFSGGFPPGWSSYSINTQGSFATCPWNWTLDGTWGYWNGNNGSSPSNSITSTTASNGFLISDTDSANHYAYGQPSGTTYKYIESSFTTSAIDLSLHPSVSLEFEHLFRYNNLGAVEFTPPTVYVSSDSINWTPFLVNGSISNNTQSSNPQYQIINITAVAGGQSTVYLRFGWVSRCYYWMIDDIRLIKTPDNLVVSYEEAMGGWWINYQTVGGLGQDYTHYPLSQATANPYAFEAVLLNNGAATQVATMHAKVSGTSNWSTTSNPLTLAAGTQDTVQGINKFTPTATGLYNIEMWAVADSAGLGNVITYTDTTTKMTMVTNYIYGKDNGTNDGGSWRLNRISPDPGGFEVSSNYDIYANATLYSVDAHISDWSIPGAEVYAVLYEEDIAGGDPILITQSDPYAITQLDLGAWVNIPFLTPQSLTSATKMYRIAIGANLHPTDTVGVDVSDAGDYYSSQGLFDTDGILNGTVQWYTISDIPMLRMNFDPSTTAISDVKQTIFNLYPNPTNGIFVIELDAISKYDVRVYNVLGQTVYTTSTNAMSTTVDLSSFDKGIYTVELKDENTIYTEKVIVE